MKGNINYGQMLLDKHKIQSHEMKFLTTVLGEELLKNGQNEK
jgi:hypothetical protein